jgi:hypothetical protein
LDVGQALVGRLLALGLWPLVVRYAASLDLRRRWGVARIVQEHYRKLIEAAKNK